MDVSLLSLMPLLVKVLNDGYNEMYLNSSLKDLHYFSDSEHNSVGLAGLMPRQELRRLRNRYHTIVSKRFSIIIMVEYSPKYAKGWVTF